MNSLEILEGNQHFCRDRENQEESLYPPVTHQSGQILHKSIPASKRGRDIGIYSDLEVANSWPGKQNEAKTRLVLQEELDVRGRFHRFSDSSQLSPVLSNVIPALHGSLEFRFHGMYITMQTH